MFVKNSIVWQGPNYQNRYWFKSIYFTAFINNLFKNYSSMEERRRTFTEIKALKDGGCTMDNFYAKLMEQMSSLVELT